MFILKVGLVTHGHIKDMCFYGAYGTLEEAQAATGISGWTPVSSEYPAVYTAIEESGSVLLVWTIFDDPLDVTVVCRVYQFTNVLKLAWEGVQSPDVEGEDMGWIEEAIQAD